MTTNNASETEARDTPTSEQRQSSGRLVITAIPAFTDNYIWSLERDNSTWVVDPGDANPVEAHLAENGLTLAGIIVTHHHFDHTGGIPDLLKNRDIPVIGPGSIDVVNKPVADGDCATFQGLDWQVMAVPGHTLDHIAFFSDTLESSPILLCGDTLFAGGCGRLFEGTPAQMHSSLAKLSALPSETLVYCTHEYTQANLAFASEVEPTNAKLRERVKTVREKRLNEEITLPSTMQLETDTNPFLRASLDTVKTSAEAHAKISCLDEVAVFAAIRAWKDSF